MHEQRLYPQLLHIIAMSEWKKGKGNAWQQATSKPRRGNGDHRGGGGGRGRNGQPSSPSGGSGDGKAASQVQTSTEDQFVQGIAAGAVPQWSCHCGMHNNFGSRRVCRGCGRCAPEATQRLQRQAVAAAKSSGGSSGKGLQQQNFAPVPEESKKLLARIDALERQLRDQSGDGSAKGGGERSSAEAQEPETPEQEADREVADLEAILDALRWHSSAKAQAKFEETKKELEAARIRAHGLWSPERQRRRAEARLAKATASKAKKEEVVKNIFDQITDLRNQEVAAKDALAQATAQEKELIDQLAVLPTPQEAPSSQATSKGCPPIGATCTKDFDAVLSAFSADDEEPEVVEAAKVLRAAAEKKRMAAAAAEAKHKRPAPDEAQGTAQANLGAMETEDHGLEETAIFDGVEGLSEDQKSILAANLAKRRKTSG